MIVMILDGYILRYLGDMPRKSIILGRTMPATECDVS